MQRSSWQSNIMAISASMADDKPNIESVVPQGENTLLDGELGMRVSTSLFEGAPSGAVVIDAAEQKRLRQFHPVSVDELLYKGDEVEYYCGSEYEEYEEDEENEPEVSRNEYDMSDGFIISKRKRSSTCSSSSCSSSSEAEESFYEEEDDEDVFPERKRRRQAGERRLVERREEVGSCSEEEEDHRRGKGGIDKREEICPLCFYGNTEFDKIACEKADSMWKLLATAFFSLTSTRMCAFVCYAQYYEEWYLPSYKRARKAGHSNHLPKWSVDGMYEHITEHMGDPRIYLGTTIERLRKLETLLNRFCFEKNAEGQARPNLSVINQARMMSKHIIDLYKTEPREMFGYCESWEANPKDINRFVNLTRCRIDSRRIEGGSVPS
jgi:hypothetical protein